MYIKKVTLNDYKCFVGKHEFTFDKINLVSGKNGVGKSTLALHSILFGIYGYTEVNISSLSPRLLTNPNTYVEIELSYNGIDFIIKRSIPTNISIKVNGIESTLANNQLKQKYLEDFFQDVEFFRKFRMIDIKDSINILEQGNQALRKTLVNFDDSMDISTIRTNLSAKKIERDKYNKDTSVLYTHYPSDKRLKVLANSLSKVIKELSGVEADIRENESILYEIANRKTSYLTKKAYLTTNKNSVMATNNCPVCKQQVQKSNQATILGDFSQQINKLDNEIVIATDDWKTQQEVLNCCKEAKVWLLKKRDIALKYIHRMEARLKQKDYIYTTKDVELMKKCIGELDGFTVFFITEKLQRLEPLINTILSKLGFVVQFDIDSKNNFDITLIDNNKGAEFKYKDLSNGQRLLVTVAFQLALLMEKNESGIIIADEGFSSLDQDNLELMFDLFKNSSFQLISIVHRFDTKDPSVKNIGL